MANAVFYCEDVGGNSASEKSMSGEASVDDHIIALGDHQSLLVFARRGERPMRLNKPSRPG